jgi:multidrug efflux pump subunit AcrB
MSWLSRISLANRKLAALITIIVVAFGAYAASSLKQQLIPNISTGRATYAASPNLHDHP